MTPMQNDIWTLMAEGLTNKEIASRVQRGEKTIKAHATAIYKALGVTSRGRAIALYYRPELQINPPAKVSHAERVANATTPTLPEPLDLRRGEGHIASNE